MHKGQEILEKQNQEESLEMLLAQRKLYSQAKVLQYILVCCCGLIPITISILDNYTALALENTWWYVLYIVIITIGELCLEHFINSQKQIAVSIQEKFDLSLYNLPQNPTLHMPHCLNEFIRKYSKRARKNPEDIHLVRNWYSQEISILSTNIAILYCQKENIDYDQKIKKRYSYIQSLISILTCLILLMIALLNDLSIKKVLIEVLLPSLPIIIFTYREHQRVKESIDNLNKLQNIIEGLTLDCSIETEVEESKLRQIQDGIFNNRLYSPLVPDWLYKLLRWDTEDEMDYSIKHGIQKLKGNNNK